IPGTFSTDERLRLQERTVDDASSVGHRLLRGQALHSWGDELFTVGRYGEALAKLDVAAAVFQAVDAPSELGFAFNSIGRVYRAHGRLDEALKYQLKALALHERSNGSYALMQSLNAVGAVYLAMDDYARSQQYYERALAVAEKASTPRIQDFLRANVAVLHVVQGQFERGAR